MRRHRPLLLLIAGIILIAVAGGGVTAISKKLHKAAPPVTTAQALAYVKKELGKPYVWGGPTMPGTGAGFDCAGLIWAAYKWPADLRTSQDQWAHLRHVSRRRLRPGDLVFFHGYLMKGENPPGHVGIVTGPHEMIDAYASGFPVEYDTFGTSDSKQGLQVIWGYASPG